MVLSTFADYDFNWFAIYNFRALAATAARCTEPSRSDDEDDPLSDDARLLRARLRAQRTAPDAAHREDAEDPAQDRAEDLAEDAEEALANARRLCAQLRGQRAAAAAKDGAFGEAQLGSTDTQRVDKLHVSYTAWARNLSQIEDSDRRTQHIGHGFVMCSDLEPGCRLVSAFLTTLERERLWLSDSWLSPMDQFLNAGLPRGFHVDSPTDASTQTQPSDLNSLNNQIALLSTKMRSMASGSSQSTTAGFGGTLRGTPGVPLPSGRLRDFTQRRFYDYYHSDQRRLISGAFINPQPEGRYITNIDSRQEGSCVAKLGVDRRGCRFGQL